MADHWATIEQALQVAADALHDAAWAMRYGHKTDPPLPQPNTIVLLQTERVEKETREALAAVGEAKRYEGILLAGMQGASDNAAQLAEELGEAKRREGELERTVEATKEANVTFAALVLDLQARVAELESDRDWQERECGLRNVESAAANVLIAELKERVADLERALREEFFRQLPDLDYETENGWAWRAHPWFVLLGLTDDEAREALGVRGEATEK